MPWPCELVHLDKTRSSLFREAASRLIRVCLPITLPLALLPRQRFLEFLGSVADSIIEGDGTLVGILPPSGQYRSTFKVGRTLTSVLHQSSCSLSWVPAGSHVQLSRLPALGWPRGPAPLPDGGATSRRRAQRRGEGGAATAGDEGPQSRRSRSQARRRAGPGAQPPEAAAPPRPEPRVRRFASGGAGVCGRGQRRPPAGRAALPPVASRPRRRARPAPSRHHAEGECARLAPRAARGVRRPSRPAPGRQGKPGRGRGAKAEARASRGAGRSLRLCAGRRRLRPALGGTRGAGPSSRSRQPRLSRLPAATRTVDLTISASRAEVELFPHPAPPFWGEPLSPRSPSRLGSPLRSELGASARLLGSLVNFAGRRGWTPLAHTRERRARADPCK